MADIRKPVTVTFIPRTQIGGAADYIHAVQVWREDQGLSVELSHFAEKMTIAGTDKVIGLRDFLNAVIKTLPPEESDEA